MFVAMDDFTDDEYWSPQEASEKTGFNQETIRNWARGDEPRVRSRQVLQGRKQLVRVLASDVRREAAISTPQKAVSHARREPIISVSGPDGGDRAAVLEEIVQLHRMIADCNADIQQCQTEISRHWSAIEMLLLGPSGVPESLTRQL